MTMTSMFKGNTVTLADWLGKWKDEVNEIVAKSG